MRVVADRNELYLDTIADSEDQQPAILRPESYPVRNRTDAVPQAYARRTKTPGAVAIWVSQESADQAFQTGRSTRRNGRDICTGTDRLYNRARKHGVKTAWGTDLLCEPVLAGRKAKW